MLDDFYQKKKQEGLRWGIISSFVSDMNEQDQFIDSVKSVKKKLEQEKGTIFKEREILNVMKNDLNMKFRKVVHVTMQANSTKNLVLR